VPKAAKRSKEVAVFGSDQHFVFADQYCNFPIHCVLPVKLKTESVRSAIDSILFEILGRTPPQSGR
jgi:hypothetical protein